MALHLWCSERQKIRLKNATAMSLSMSLVLCVAGGQNPGQAGPAGIRLPGSGVGSHPVRRNFLQRPGAELQHPVHLQARGGGLEPGRAQPAAPLLPEEPGGRQGVPGPPRPETGQVHPGLLSGLQRAGEEGTPTPHSGTNSLLLCFLLFHLFPVIFLHLLFLFLLSSFCFNHLHVCPPSFLFLPFLCLLLLLHSIYYFYSFPFEVLAFQLRTSFSLHPLFFNFVLTVNFIDAGLIWLKCSIEE